MSVPIISEQNKEIKAQNDTKKLSELEKDIQRKIKSLEVLQKSIESNFQTHVPVDARDASQIGDYTFFKVVALKDKHLCKKRIDELYKSKKKSNLSDAFGIFPIHYAAFFGNFVVVKALLKAEPTLWTVTDQNGLNILHYAALSKTNADNTKSSTNITKQCIALAKKKKSNQPSFINHGALIVVENDAKNKKSSNTIMSPLAVNSFLNHSTAIQAIIEAGASIDINHNQQITPLLLALYHFHNNKTSSKKIVNLLLEKTQSISVQQQQLTQMLKPMILFENGHAFDFCLEENADYLLEDQDGKHAYHHVIDHEFERGYVLLRWHSLNGGHDRNERETTNPHIFLAYALINRKKEMVYAILKNFHDNSTFEHVPIDIWRKIETDRETKQDCDNLLKFAVKYNYVALIKLIIEIIHKQCERDSTYFPQIRVVEALEFGLGSNNAQGQYYEGAFSLVKILKNAISPSHFLKLQAEDFLKILHSSYHFYDFLKDYPVEFRRLYENNFLWAIHHKNVYGLEQQLNDIGPWQPIDIIALLKKAIDNKFSLAFPVLLELLLKRLQQESKLEHDPARKFTPLQIIAPFVSLRLSPITVRTIARKIQSMIKNRYVSDYGMKKLVTEYLKNQLAKRMLYNKSPQPITPTSSKSFKKFKPTTPSTWNTVPLVSIDFESPQHTLSWYKMISCDEDLSILLQDEDNLKELVSEILRYLPYKKEKFSGIDLSEEDDDLREEDDYANKARLNRKILSFMATPRFFTKLGLKKGGDFSYPNIDKPILPERATHTIWSFLFPNPYIDKLPGISFIVNQTKLLMYYYQLIAEQQKSNAAKNGQETDPKSYENPSPRSHAAWDEYLRENKYNADQPQINLIAESSMHDKGDVKANVDISHSKYTSENGNHPLSLTARCYEDEVSIHGDEGKLNADHFEDSEKDEESNSLLDHKNDEESNQSANGVEPDSSQSHPNRGLNFSTDAQAIQNVALKSTHRDKFMEAFNKRQKPGSKS